MGQRHKHADVIIAWAEGKDVQVWNESMSKWIDLAGGQPNFMSDKYRIKPQAKKYRAALFNNGKPYTSTADSPEDEAFLQRAPGFVRWLTDWIEYEE